MSTTATTGSRSSSVCSTALEEFGAEPRPDHARRDLRGARHRLARPRRARADRRGRVRRRAQGRGHGGHQDRPAGGRPGGVEAGDDARRRHHRRRRRHAAGRRRRAPCTSAGARASPGSRTASAAATEFEPDASTCRVKEVRRADRFTQLALAAAGEALEPTPAGTTARPYDPDRVGCVIGTGIGGIGTLEAAAHDPAASEGPTGSRRSSIPLLMANAPRGVMAMKHGLRGQSFGTVSACAAGAHAIGMAARLIRLRRRRRGRHRRQRGRAHAARDRRRSRAWTRSRDAASRAPSTGAATAS